MNHDGDRASGAQHDAMLRRNNEGMEAGTPSFKFSANISSKKIEHGSQIFYLLNLLQC